MAAPLTPVARAELAPQAYLLALKRLTYGEISQRLGVSRPTVASLINQAQEQDFAARDLTELEHEKKLAIASYQTVIREAWRRLEQMPDKSLNVAALFNSIISAQKAIDDITGVKAPRETKVTHQEIIDLGRFSAETIEEIKEVVLWHDESEG